MSDESVKISAKTWARTVDCINKVGYSDGVVSGQEASFQFSFDTGYKQGFEFGFKLGLRKTLINHKNNRSVDNFHDPRRINCQICVNNNSNTDNIINLYNRQHEKNNEHCIE